MKFRFYQLYYLLAAVSLIVAMCGVAGRCIADNGAVYTINNFSLLTPDGTTSYSVVALGVVLVVAVLVDAFGLFVSLFNNFELQKRSSILSMLLLTGYYILYALYVFLIIYSDETLLTLNLDDIAIFLPFVALIFNFMAFSSARRTEAQILAKASGFRLRD